MLGTLGRLDRGACRRSLAAERLGGVARASSQGDPAGLTGLASIHRMMVRPVPGHESGDAL